MGDDSIIGKAREKLKDVVDAITGEGEQPKAADAPGAGDTPGAGDAPGAGDTPGAGDPEHEARLRAAAATGGTPDVPVGTEEDVKRQSEP